MKRYMAALLSFMLILTAYSGTVQAIQNDTNVVSEQQYTRVGEDYDILDEQVLSSKKDGTAWMWYINNGASHYTSDIVYKAHMVQIPGLKDVKQVDVRRSGGTKDIRGYVALKNDGTVWYWDAKRTEHLPYPTDDPSLIKDLSNVTSFVAKFDGNYKVLFVLKSDGSVWSWGRRTGNSKNAKSSLKQIKLLDDVVSLQSIGGLVFAIKKDGSVWKWRSSSYFPQNRTNSKTVDQITGLSGVVNIDPGSILSYAYKQDGTVWSWRTYRDDDLPVQLHHAADSRMIVQLDTIRDANLDKTYAFRTDGQLWSVENDKVFPDLKDIVSVHQKEPGGLKRYYVLKKDQTLWAWESASNFPKLVVFTKRTEQRDGSGTVGNQTDNQKIDKQKDSHTNKSADKQTGDRPKTTTEPRVRTVPEISLYPYVTILPPGGNQTIAVNNLLPGTKVTYAIDDPSIGTLSYVNGTAVVKANKPGQTIVRATATRAGYPDVTTYFMLYVADSNRLSDTYFTAVRTVPAADKQKPYIVEGLTQAGELVISAASSEQPVPVNGQVVITPELMNRVAGSALKAKSAVEQSLSESGIVLARELVINGEVLSSPGQNGYTFKLHKDSLVGRKDIDYITVHAGDAKLMIHVATADSLFHSYPVIVIHLVQVSNGRYQVQFLDEQGRELPSVASNIGLVLPATQSDATNNSVFYTDGTTTQPIGGKFNPYKNGVEAEINRPGTYFLGDNSKSFPDVDDRDPELQQAVQFLASKGIVKGKAGGKFEPDSLITRAEFTSMLVKAFYALDKTATESFSDVQSPQWHHPYIASSEKKDIVKGYPDGTFKPDKTIAREEMIAIGARYLHEKKNYYYPSNPDIYLNQFEDKKTISNWAKRTMALAIKQRLIDVPANKQIKAREAVTRGEATRMLYRLYLQI
ncbi:S-layer homology domain-containing protein [Paenibacillus sp. SC116]|uniref:S-layer homology domain-containing protein n=1 Tax=Paenibacillus sp. SC116 TaxID=2968986 RepID=UPI00215B1E78|nr:S-layer homology domain-containing protein [Paenibacillus sp. SC116]MCR8843882.1 S-layer homology domain-containing protein [Paenibacillus sp. SC116]